MLNQKRKRQEEKKKTSEAHGEKWCPVPGKEYGCHGYYTGAKCPKCHPAPEKIHRIR